MLAQGTVEYAIVLSALLAMLLALAGLWHAAASGALAHLVEMAASHALDVLGFLDIALY